MARHFVDRVEVVEDGHDDGSGDEVDQRPTEVDLAGVDEPNVTDHAVGWVGREVLLAVMLWYLRTGNTFMKLRPNIPNILCTYNQLPHSSLHSPLIRTSKTVGGSSDTFSSIIPINFAMSAFKSGFSSLRLPLHNPELEEPLRKIVDEIVSYLIELIE